MSSKTTWTLIAIAAVLFGLIFFVEHPLREKAHSQQLTRKIFPQFDPLAVTDVTILADQLISVHRGTNQWTLTKPISYPAASERIESLLNVLASIEWVAGLTADDLKDRPQAQEEYGFAPPRFSITAQAGDKTYRLLIGTNFSMGDQLFVQVVGDNTIFRVDGELLKFIPSNKDQWRDPRLVNLADIPYEMIKVRAGSKTYDLQREPQGHWNLKTLQARADATKVEAMLKQLEDIRILSFLPDQAQNDLETYGLQSSPQTPELDIAFLKNTNVLFEIQAGASPTNHTDQVYVRRLSQGNVVLVPKQPLASWRSANTNFVDRHMISSLSDTIDSIEIHGDTRFALVRDSEDHWTVKGEKSFPADAQLVRGIMEVFTNVEVEIEKPVVADFASYGFSSNALQYTIKGGGSATNIIGQIEFGSNVNGKVFERRVDEPSLNSIPAPLFERLPKATWQLRDRAIWNFASNDVIRITVHQKGSVRKYLRDPQSNWTFAPGSRGTINAFSLEETLYRLGHLRAVYWSGIGADNLERFGFKETDFRITLEVKNGSKMESYNIQFGKASPYLHPYAMIERDGERLVFEFPVDLYSNGIWEDLSIPPALREYHKE